MTTNAIALSTDEFTAMLAQEASKSMDKEAGTGKFISLRGGKLNWKGAALPGNALKCVIMDYAFENTLYLSKFNPDAIQSPDCYALSTSSEEELVPQGDNPVNPTCKGCKWNEWGSMPGSKGKKCRNSRRLALLPYTTAENLMGTEMCMLKIPVTSTANFSSYVRQISVLLNRPIIGVITEISVHPDPKNQFAVQFKMVEPLDMAAIMEVFPRKEEAKRELLSKYVSKALPKPSTKF